jgi:hypothetical protein
MQKAIAFIGSRELSQFPQEWTELYCQSVRAAVKHGYTVVTGAARGSDQLAANTARIAGGRIRLILPWTSYECEWWVPLKNRYEDQVEIVTFDPDRDLKWIESVVLWHPAAEKLSRGSAALHARNYGIIEAAFGVVALPSTSKPGEGGTGQGLRIARDLGKKIWDLTQDHERILLKNALKLPG